MVHRRRKDLPDSPALHTWLRRHAGTAASTARDAESQYVKLVFVNDGGIARARPIETGLIDERRVEIVSGVDPKDRVIVGPFRALDELRDGSPVDESRAHAPEGGSRP
jgi:HlyD family secretion protein